MKDDVFRFNIPVQDVVVVHKLNSMAHLLDNRSNLLLAHLFLRFQQVIETARVA